MQANPASHIRYQASSAFIGLITIFVVGLAGCVAIILATLWLISQLAYILISASIETLNAIGLLYLSSDPLIKFVLLVAVAYGVYHVIKGRKNG